MDKGLLAITRRRLLTGAATGSAALLAGCASGEGAVLAEPDEKKDGSAGAFPTPHLTVGADTARSVTVEWVNPGTDRLELRAAGSGPLLKSIESPASDVTLEGLGFPLHAVRLTDLAPATAYEYRIGESGRWHGFRTASDSTVRVLVFTDTQSKGLFKTWKRICRAASGPYYFVCGVAGNLPHDIAAAHKLDMVRGTRPEFGNYLFLEADSGRLSVKCFLPDSREFDRAELVKKGGAA